MRLVNGTLPGWDEAQRFAPSARRPPLTSRWPSVYDEGSSGDPPFAVQEVTVRSRLAFCLSASWVMLLGLWGCGSDDSTAPDPAPPGSPVSRWSDPRTWPGRVLPTQGAAVVIPQEKTVILDVDPPSLASLAIEGTLEFADQDLSLTTGWILVHGTLRIGSEQQPFTRKATITLTGIQGEDVQGMGTKVIGVMGGTLELHGPPRVSWTRLAATALPGSS